MIARGLRARSGITLTEILIAILIMGIGLISLATLFPLGLLRLREATRASRAGLAYETAADDMDARALFFKPSFLQTWYWTLINKKVVPRDPFVQDADSNGGIGDGTQAGGVIASGSGLIPNNNANLDTGLPFCYDPLWRSITGVVPNVALADPTLDFQPKYATSADEARFGAGILAGTHPYLRNDPDGNAPSAYGLQRLTNFIPWSNAAGSLNNQYPFTCLNTFYSTNGTPQPADVSGNVFTSIDDIVFNPTGGGTSAPSSVLPDMSVSNGPNPPSPQADYRFTWFVTGRQSDAGGNGSQFAGEVVVCDGRPFGFDPLPGLSTGAPAGESVVEAVYGYGANVVDLGTGSGFTLGSDRSVLLRWPAAMTDPQVRVGGWICDVTYERNVGTYYSRAVTGLPVLARTAFVRCNWYQIGKRTDPAADSLIPGSGYRSMVVTLTSPVRSKTLLDATSGLPIHVNVALVMPSVINVFPRAFEVH